MNIKQWIARIVLTFGYSAIAGAIVAIIYEYHTYLGYIGFVVICTLGVLLAWIGYVWLLHVFAWAHNNWRKK